MWFCLKVGGGDRIRTCKGFRPAVFKTASLPLGYPSSRGEVSIGECCWCFQDVGLKFEIFERFEIDRKEELDKKITEGKTRAGSPFRFLRPFNGCVPQPSKKRRLFDSHNPNSLMVAELDGLYQT